MKWQIRITASWILFLILISASSLLQAQDNSIKPDMVNGSTLFVEHCVACHGATGIGDGERVVSGEIAATGDLTDPAHIDGQTPRDYFNIITNGIDNTDMPAWDNELTDTERWSLAIFTYTRHYIANQINLGAQIYTRECASCHGESGLGDGEEMPESSRSDGNLTNFTDISTLSDQHLTNIVVEGAGDDMPAYMGNLSVDEVQAVVTYTRLLSVDNAIAHEELVELQPVTGRITGQLLPMSADVTLLPNALVTLHIFDHDFNEQTFSTTASASGHFTFDNIAISQGYLYFATIKHKERQFSSLLARGDIANPFIDFPITIYDITDDPSVISISTILTQIDSSEDVPNLLQINQFFRFSNNSLQAYSTNKQLGDSRFVSLEIPFPIGATIIGLENYPSYVFDETTFTLIDTRPVMPGDNHEIQVAYLIPYGKGALIDYPVNYDTNAILNLLIDTDKISVESSQLAEAGIQELGEKTYNLYSGELNLNAEESIKYELFGSYTPLEDENNELEKPASTPKIIIIAIVTILVTAIIAIMVITRPRRNNIVGAIMKELSNLETQHNHGEINHDLYRHRQKELKTRLRELTGEDT